ncbi:MAG: hypothetical protein LBL38_02850 [Lactobacillales bacterium]|jgi:DNA repair exonuclease SbcCD ATPase subunit|nr:hypothetical protein [Lactobacillales bacterium]MDR1253906.1 hypothetical protein [Oscillospiraceae bacterium]
MTVTEKSAYIKGLFQGLQLDETKSENKVLKEIIDLLDDITLEVSELEQSHSDLKDQVDEIDENLCVLEEDYYDDNDVGEKNSDSFYEIPCPNCEKIICLSKDVLLKSPIDCPNCGEGLEFDFNSICDKNCGCIHEHCQCDFEPQVED